jgi:hypothetical protein
MSPSAAPRAVGPCPSWSRVARPAGCDPGRTDRSVGPFGRHLVSGCAWIRTLAAVQAPSMSSRSCSARASGFRRLTQLRTCCAPGSFSVRLRPARRPRRQQGWGAGRDRQGDGLLPASQHLRGLVPLVGRQDAHPAAAGSPQVPVAACSSGQHPLQPLMPNVPDFYAPWTFYEILITVPAP